MFAAEGAQHDQKHEEIVPSKVGAAMQVPRTFTPIHLRHLANSKTRATGLLHPASVAADLKDAPMRNALEQRSGIPGKPPYSSSKKPSHPMHNVEEIMWFGVAWVFAHLYWYSAIFDRYRLECKATGYRGLVVGKERMRQIAEGEGKFDRAMEQIRQGQGIPLEELRHNSRGRKPRTVCAKNPGLPHSAII